MCNFKEKQRKLDKNKYFRRIPWTLAIKWMAILRPQRGHHMTPLGSLAELQQLKHSKISPTFRSPQDKLLYNQIELNFEPHTGRFMTLSANLE